MNIKKLLPKISLGTIRKTFLIILIVLFSSGVGYYLGSANLRAEYEKFPKVVITRELPPGKQTLDFSLFWRIWDTLHSSYLDKDNLIDAKLVYGAIRGMVAAVGDPYTVFLSPDENRVVQEDLSGQFEGVGIQIGFKGSRLAVISPLPDTPAESSGIKAGDLIVGIIDEQKGIDRGTDGITLPEAVQLIRGPAGSKVTLVLTREGSDEPFEIEVVRSRIDVASIELKFVGEGENVAYIRVLKFGEETFAEWDSTVSEVLQSGVKKAVLDLRNNPGGYLQGAVDLGAEFLDNGRVVVIEENANGERSELKSESIGKLKNLDLVVLVNGGSASASEILAGALRDDLGVTIVGEKTFGKGTIQEPQQFEGGASLHITIAKWLTPKGTWVNDSGLEPDVTIEDNPDTEEDEQLLKAIEILSANSQD